MLCDVMWCDFPFLPCRMEDEAVLDRGASFVKNVCEEEVEGKRSDEHYLANRSFKLYFSPQILFSSIYAGEKHSFPLCPGARAQGSFHSETWSLEWTNEHFVFLCITGCWWVLGNFYPLSMCSFRIGTSVQMPVSPTSQTATEPNISVWEDVFSCVLILSSAKATKEFIWRHPHEFTETFTCFTNQHLRVHTKRTMPEFLALWPSCFCAFSSSYKTLLLPCMGPYI